MITHIDCSPRLGFLRDASRLLVGRTNRFSVLQKVTQIIAGFLLILATALNASAGFSIQNGLLIDGKGNEFILRGINYPHVWFPTQTATSIPNIAATGANCVRIVLGSGQQWGPNSAADVAQVIQLCKANKLIAILEVHDCTGFGESPNAAPVSTAVDYWISIQSVLKGQEDFVIINVANEPLGNGVPAATWVSVHTAAITRLRAAGFTHTLMIDGANWGQDWEKAMFNNAASVFAVDPLKNTIFSVHMYSVFALRSTIQSYLTAFVTNHIPIVVGEFGWAFQGQVLDAPSVMDICQTLGIGYMGWSWSGNGGADAPLDLTINFNPANLSNWGTMLINDVNGIASTAELSTVFGAVASLRLSPSALNPPATGNSATVNVTSNQSWTVTKNQPWITVTPLTGLNNGSLTVTTAANPNLGPRSGTVTVSGGGLNRNITINQLGTGGPGVCNNPVTISLPFVQNGSGEFCWISSGDISTINSWNLEKLEINGVDFTNKFAAAFPPRINGNYYIHYISGVSGGHFEAAGSNTTTNVPTTGVTVSPATVSVTVGSTTPLTATVAPATATNKAVIWSSSSPAVATVNASGVVTGVTAGTATITATTQSGNFTASSIVTVTPVVNVPATGVSVTPATVNVAIGSTTTLTATVAPANASNKAVTWSSSSASVATVSASGVVTGLAAGVTTITATTASGGFTASSVVTVIAAPPPPLCTSPAPSTLPLVRNGAGDFCFVTSGTISFINSWNMQRVEINGVDFTNKWANSLPPKINGTYTIHYVANVAWAHLEVNGTP